MQSGGFDVFAVDRLAKNGSRAMLPPMNFRNGPSINFCLIFSKLQGFFFVHERAQATGIGTTRARGRFEENQVFYMEDHVIK